MKIIVSFLNKLSAKGGAAQQDIFDQRLTKMVAPAPAARNRRARSTHMPSVFRGRQALAH